MIEGNHLPINGRIIFGRSARKVRSAERKAVIDRNHKLPVVRQAEALNIRRGSVYCTPRPVSQEDLALMRRIEDITYIPMAAGFVYLVAIVDCFSLRVLSYQLSITMDGEFSVEALQEALAKYGKPDVFNSDQGSHFTTKDFTDVLKAYEIDISMDGKGAWRDNVFVERIWKSVKYEEYTCAPMTALAMYALLSAGIWSFITTAARIRALTGYPG